MDLGANKTKLVKSVSLTIGTDVGTTSTNANCMIFAIAGKKVADAPAKPTVPSNVNEITKTSSSFTAKWSGCYWCYWLFLRCFNSFRFF